MRKSRLPNRLVKSKGLRALIAGAAMLLLCLPFAYAFTQVVSKYPTGYTIAQVDMGGGNMLDQGGIFGFNSAKSAADADAYADIMETACLPEATRWQFISGLDGFVTSSSIPQINVFYDSSNNGIEVVDAGKSKSGTFQLDKTFFYDCGTPSLITFSTNYEVTKWNVPGGTNNFQVDLIQPDTTTVNIIGSTAFSGITASTLVNGTIAPADLAQSGTYTIRISGNISTGNNNQAEVNVIFQDVNLQKSSNYTDFRSDVEFTINATPISSLDDYLLDIRARKPAGDTENTLVQVWDGGAWNTRYTVSSTTWNTFNTYSLTVPEYNNGVVRVRYLDTLTSGDNAGGGVQVEYQRVTVDQGVCVDSVQNIEADCGKCHNYGGDVTKPWPDFGMHNQHAQTESISDCLWCHPDNGTNANHRDGNVVVDGTIVSSLATPLNGGVASSYNTGTKVCSNIYCHDPNTLGQSSPAWDAVYGVDIERNCSRCHNGGAPAADNPGDLNLASAWPVNAGQGHTSHDTAFNIDEVSCQTAGSCHPDNRSQHSVVGDGKTEVAMSPAYASPNKTLKYLDTGKTCVNVSCHGGIETPGFDNAFSNPIDVATECEKCHTPESVPPSSTDWSNAAQWNAPISGLHRGSPPTSGKSHVADFGCTQCHGLPTEHFMTGGVTNLDTQAMDLPPDNMTANGYVVGAGSSPDFAGGSPTCATTGIGCHAEADTNFRNPPTSWARRWDWDSYSSTPVDRCNGCHGHWGTFNAGVVEPHVFSNTNTNLRTNLIDNHQDVGDNCATLCHGQTDTSDYVDGPSPTTSGYNHGVAITATNKTMDINNNISRFDNGDATIGCTDCHGSTGVDATDGPGTGHAFDEATWLKLNRPDGPAAGGCITCHGDTVMTPAAIGAVTGENGNFDTAGGHRHHGGGAGSNGAVTDDVCTACHANTSQNMSEASATLDKIQLKHADTGAVIEWDQNAPNEANLVTFCLSCHDSNGANGNMDPFGDGVAPPDISALYNGGTGYTMDAYSFNTVPRLTKARSPHGKPGSNDMKQSTDQSTYDDANPVGCNNCHPSHGGTALNPTTADIGASSPGSDVSGITGKMMKSGYSEPGVCFTCHNSAGVKDYYGDNTGGGNWTGVQNSAFAYKQRPYWSTHQVKAGAFSNTGAQDSTANVACTICHNPHGATSGTWNGTATEYQSFSLRGNWLTSPYLEDRAGKMNAATAPNYADKGPLGPRTDVDPAYNLPPEYGNGYGATGGDGHDGYYLDQNTFGGTTAGHGNTDFSTMSASDGTTSNFAGLCANCHGGALTGGTVGAMETELLTTATTTGWGAEIHATVNGWNGNAADADIVNFTNNPKMRLLHSTYGSSIRVLQVANSYSPRTEYSWGADLNDTAGQKYHQFSCSKCHTPHASSLPRLLISNCLDVRAGGSTTTQRASVTATTNPGSTPRYAFNYPTFGAGWSDNPADGEGVAQHCHNAVTENATNGWNKLTGWDN